MICPVNRQDRKRKNVWSMRHEAARARRSRYPVGLHLWTHFFFDALLSLNEEITTTEQSRDQDVGLIRQARLWWLCMQLARLVKRKYLGGELVFAP